DWRTDTCGEGLPEGTECATMTVPRDYDDPAGAQTEVALARRPADDRDNRIGSLVANPGGPGGPGRGMVAYAFGEDVRRRFDIVGFDPRGVGASERLDCAAAVPSDAEVGFVVPGSAAEWRTAVRDARAFGRECSTSATGGGIGAAMSTAQVARDMDVLRRALGDERLTYFGVSYGSVLGQYYANMFPDRLRAVAVDGVLDARQWRGDGGTADLPTFLRTGTVDATARTVRALLSRCRAVGADDCPLAALGDPATVYAQTLQRLRRQPLTLPTSLWMLPGTDGDVVRDDGLAVLALFGMYQGNEWIDDVADLIRDAAVAADPDSTEEARTAARAGMRAYVHMIVAPYDALMRGIAAPYTAVMCTDGPHPALARQWLQPLRHAVRRGGPAAGVWTLADQSCATDAWTTRDEDRYTGRLDRRTAAPVLVVGNRWDPATSYRNALSVDRLLPHSRLVLSDSWGHHAYGFVDCVREATDQYLVTGGAPDIQRCTGRQPFTADDRAATPRERTPLAPLLPVS
ncbi:MAG TPA: alpha/beta hydrolase, partial [Pilimelia sp.]|nr:alpha/beta hydrolase [Pilimelia sp.]